jgi:hypothetical protein
MDYDMTIHHNPDARAWAKFFIETTKDMDREVFRDEGYMIAWFSNAMMAMHDYLHKTEIERLREALGMWLRYSKSDYDDHAQMIIDWSKAEAATKDVLKEKE